MRFTPYALLTCLLMLPFTSWAEELTELLPHRNERDYIIELLIFTQEPGEGATEKPGQPQILQALDTPAYALGPTPWWNRISQHPLESLAIKPKQLTRQARALERSSDYRLLFHEAWRMPVVGEDRSLPLLVEGGDYFGEQPELSGYLRLSVARYLHLETQLYLHSFEPLENLADTSAAHQQLTGNRSSLPVDANLSQHLEASHAEGSANLSVRVEQPTFAIKASAPMQQRRRMRSNELHFIDSPYLGLLIRIERAP